MKRIYIIFAFLLTTGLAWADTISMQFITTLSSPVGSFDTVETKSCEVITPQGRGFDVPPTEDAKVYFGSGESDHGGTVTLKGQKPMTIGKFQMTGSESPEKNSAVFGVANGKKWLVDTLEIGGDNSSSYSKGVVEIGSLIAGLVTLENAEGDVSYFTDIDVDGTLRLDANNAGVHINQVVSSGFNTQCTDITNAATCAFQYSGDGSGATMATWKSVSKSNKEEDDTYMGKIGVAVPNTSKYYPITPN